MILVYLVLGKISVVHILVPVLFDASFCSRGERLILAVSQVAPTGFRKM